jgi:hypothetical protein
MKKPALSFAALMIMFLIAFRSATNTSLPLGSPLPQENLKLKDISGNEVSMKEAMKANGLLVMFSCNTCPYVIRNQERTREICAYALKNNVGVILLNSNEGTRYDGDSFEAMQSYAKQQSYNWYYAVDKNNVLADAFGANRTPECFLFNKDARLVYHGAIDDNPQDASSIKRHHLKEAIGEIISGKEVSVKESRSVGCNIKRI